MNRFNRFTSIDLKKAFDKSQHPLIIKTPSKVGIERTHLNIIKAINDKPIANIIFKRGKTKSVSLKISNKTGMSAFTSYSA